MIFFAVAAGGACGAVLRHLVNLLLSGQGFPVHTLAVNVVGSFVLAILIEYFALVHTPSPELRAFLVVGLLGALTTFSTFSLDTMLLAERGDLKMAALYVFLSVGLALGAFVAGLSLARKLFG